MSKGATLVLVDLEQTLIDSWDQPDLLPARVAHVHACISSLEDVELGLMSWAVYNDKDLVSFANNMQKELEGVLGCNFSPRWTLSMDDWSDEIFLSTHKRLPRDELFDVFGKADVFVALSRQHPLWMDRDIILFDDAYGDVSISVPQRGVRANIVDITRLDCDYNFQDQPIKVKSKFSK